MKKRLGAHRFQRAGMGCKSIGNQTAHRHARTLEAMRTQAYSEEAHMAVRTAKAAWNGGIQTGKGTMALGSGAFEGQYSFSSRFENGAGTNPEELIGAAHAGCFSMALAATLGRAGYEPKSIR